MSEHGQGLVATIVDGLPSGVELDQRGQALLDLAARQADDLAALEADIAERGIRVPGSRSGHEVLNPAIAEARQGHLALGKLLGQLDLPEAVTSARHAAEARWGKAS
jgi:hypothetical protein